MKSLGQYVIISQISVKMLLMMQVLSAFHTHNVVSDSRGPTSRHAVNGNRLLLQICKGRGAGETHARKDA